MDRLSLHEGEEIEFVDEGDGEVVAAQQSLSLVGRFLTDRNIRIPIMKDRLADIWRPGRGVQIEEVESGLFVFQFYHQLDVQKVLKNGPWSFDKHMLVLNMVPEGVSPTDVQLTHIPFWIQVHDLAPGFMSETVGRGLGNFIGEFLEYDAKNSGNFWRSFMRIRVLVDVTQPLKRCKMIKKQGGEARIVKFKYEKLETFCYVCGRIGHAEGSCDVLFTRGSDDGVRGWRPELRVEIRRGGSGKSKWLRDGRDTEWVSPLQAFNSARNQCSNACGSSGVLGMSPAVNSSDEISGVQQQNIPGQGNTNNGNQGVPFNVEVFRNPHLFFPTKADASKVSKVGSMTTNDESNDEAMMFDADRKRQRQHGSTLSQPNELAQLSKNINASGVVVMQPTGSVSQVQSELDFLKAGPGKQACRDQ